MYLTGGQYKGRKITTPQGVRPTLSIVRESVFNVLYSHFGDFSDKKFADLFLGSGIMTLEALSRGFSTVSFEMDARVIKVVKSNMKDISSDMQIIKGDSFKSAYRLNAKYDVIYADPPWSYSYTEIFKLCSLLLNNDGIAVIECDKKKKPDILRELESFNTLELFKEKNYGRCCLLFLSCNYDDISSLST